MVEMELNKIVIDEKRHDQLIVLREKSGKKRILPIVIGLAEASAIKLKISGLPSPRPLTHDLLQTIINELDSCIEKIIIDKLEENIFHAKLVLKTKSGDTKIIDCRPSDSIALAVRARAPIFVEDEVINQSDIFNKK